MHWLTGSANSVDDIYLGANVTVPHKQAVMEHLDEVDDLARRIGAVNTIINRDGRLLGTNTDAEGFITSLKIHGDVDPAGLDAVLVGAGGAARAAAHASGGCRNRDVNNRQPNSRKGRGTCRGSCNSRNRDSSNRARGCSVRQCVRQSRSAHQLDLSRNASRACGEFLVRT